MTAIIAHETSNQQQHVVSNNKVHLSIAMCSQLGQRIYSLLSFLSSCITQTITSIFFKSHEATDHLPALNPIAIENTKPPRVYKKISSLKILQNHDKIIKVIRANDSILSMLKIVSRKFATMQTKIEQQMNREQHFLNHWRKFEPSKYGKQIHMIYSGMQSLIDEHQHTLSNFPSTLHDLEANQQKLHSLVQAIEI